MHQDIKPPVELSLVLQMKTVWPGGGVSWTQSPSRWTSCPTAFRTRWVPTGSPLTGRSDRVSGCWSISWLSSRFGGNLWSVSVSLSAVAAGWGDHVRDPEESHRWEQREVSETFTRLAALRTLRSVSLNTNDTQRFGFLSPSSFRPVLLWRGAKLLAVMSRELEKVYWPSWHGCHNHNDVKIRYSWSPAHLWLQDLISLTSPNIFWLFCSWEKNLNLTWAENLFDCWMLAQYCYHHKISLKSHNEDLTVLWVQIRRVWRSRRGRRGVRWWRSSRKLHLRRSPPTASPRYEIKLQEKIKTVKLF